MTIASAPDVKLPADPDRLSSVISPVTGSTAGSVPRHSAQDTVEAIRRGRAAQPQWAALPFKKRAQIIVRFHDLILKKRNEMFDVMQSESGKSRRDAFVEMFAVACEARYYAYNGGKYLKPERVRSTIPFRERVQIVYHPVGVVGVISPWNFPFIMSMGDSIPALLAGNAVVIKPSSHTPLTAIWGRDRLIEAGLDPDLYQVLTGPAAEIAHTLVDNVDYVMFTGSTEVGRQIAERAARRLMPYSMELGGKNALLVLPDADLKHAATVAIDGAYNNSGQVCISFERLYIHAQIYEVFVAELLKQLATVRLGTGHSFGYDVGSMISAHQADTTDAHVQDAISKGARVLFGGKRRPDLGPAFYEPTVLEGVTPEMQAYADETFGPVVSLYKVASTEEAIRLANDSPYGLHFGVYTGDLREGERIAARLRAGSVCVNDSYVNWGAMDAPMGGMKDSGVGRRHGPEGIRKYTEPQTIATNLTRFQISSFETPLSINQRLADVLALGLRLWRHVPFIR